MIKLFSILSLGLFVFSPVQSSVAFAAVAPVKSAVKPVVEVALDATIASIKGSVITVKSSDKKTLTLKFTAKVSMADEAGKALVAKGLRVGDRIKATGTLKGSVFTASRLRRASQAVPVVSVKTFTMAQVQTHNTAASCWAVIDGQVYDLTSWVGRHPGGQDAILGLCGTDGSVAFHRMHGHSGTPVTTLATFKVGTLKK